MFQNLCALTDLGHEVHLAIIRPRDQIEPEVRQRVASIHEISPNETPLLLKPLKRVLNPETFALRFPSANGYDRSIAKLATRIRPDVIWADTIFPLASAPRASYPVVFGNYDFLFKLKAVRRSTSRLKIRDLRKLRSIKRPDAMSLAALEALEMRLVAEAAHVMCVSASESDFLRERGIDSTTIPIVGPTIPVPPSRVPDGPPRFFLFGNHNTAHSAALSEIRHKLWPALERAGVHVEWHQIGRAPREPDDDWLWMTHTFDHVHGFVEDLATLFRVGDISVVPYRHDTGFRTKFTVAAGYGVASAGYDETFLCAPEFTKSENCISAADAEGLVRAFERVQKDRAWRVSLGVASRSLYDKAFTFEAQLPRYAHVLSAALEHQPRPVKGER